MGRKVEIAIPEIKRPFVFDNTQFEESAGLPCINLHNDGEFTTLLYCSRLYCLVRDFIVSEQIHRK